MEELVRPGPGTLNAFIEAWHGVRRPEYGIPPEQLAGRSLPGPLRAFYELAGRWPGLIGQNRLLQPAELEVVDGRVLFYVENQGVWLWAAAREGDDPAVWSRENSPGAPWEPEGEPLSRFLLQLVLFEAMWAATEGASAACLTAEELRLAVRPLRPLSLAPWRWPSYPSRFYAGEGVIALAGPNPSVWGTQPPDRYSLFLSARRTEALAYLAPLVGDAWEYYSPRDRGHR